MDSKTSTMTKDEIALTRNTRITMGLVMSLCGFLLWISYNMGVYKTHNENALANLSNRIDLLAHDISDMSNLVHSVTTDRISRSELESWIQKLKTASFQQAAESDCQALAIPDLRE